MMKMGMFNVREVGEKIKDVLNSKGAGLNFWTQKDEPDMFTVTFMYGRTTGTNVKYLVEVSLQTAKFFADEETEEEMINKAIVSEVVHTKSSETLQKEMKLLEERIIQHLQSSNNPELMAKPYIKRMYQHHDEYMEKAREEAIQGMWRSINTYHSADITQEERHYFMCLYMFLNDKGGN